MKNKISTREVMKYFFIELMKLKWIVVISAIWMISVTILHLLIPVYFKEIIDLISNSSISKRDALSQINVIFSYFFITILCSFTLRRINDYIIPYWEQKLDYNISLSVFDYLHRHSYNFFVNNFAWAINKKVWKLVWAFQGFYSMLFWDILWFITSLVFVVIVLSNENTYLWMWFMSWILIFVFLSYFLNKYRVPYIEKATTENSKVSWIYADGIVNNYNISVFWTFKREYNFMKKSLDTWFNLEHKFIKVDVLYFLILWIISNAMRILLLYFCIYFWYNSLISVWTFVLVLTYLISLTWQIFSITHIIWRFGMNVWNSLEMLDILKTPHEIKDEKTAKDLVVKSWKIEFKNVWFNYNKDIKVFDDFNLTINPWEKVWIVWASWSWKSSLIKLLFRFYDLNNWNILIDGEDISKVKQDSLRSQISFVPQDTILFHRSLRENIWYWKNNPSEEEIIEASKKAHCYEFISKLKDGYGTLVWERWIKLSWWERQRVSIARAMLQDNKILVLDEATSALDSESEKLIQDALENLMKNKTMIVIAHRLSTIMKMDKIIVMENWKVIESWSHKELLEKSWVYKKLWDIQSGGFIG